MENTGSFARITTYDGHPLTVDARPVGAGQLAAEVVVYGPETLRLDPAAARALAADLIDAADTAEG